MAADPGRRLTLPARALRALSIALGVAWTSPNTVLGLSAGVAGIAFGARPRFDRPALAIVFDRYPWGPGGAMTLGNVILNTHADLDGDCMTYAHRAGWCDEPHVALRSHEAAHVLQYMALGPLFLPLYFACGGVHVRNRFERAADRYAHLGRGWWPWWRDAEGLRNVPTNGRRS